MCQGSECYYRNDSLGQEEGHSEKKQRDLKYLCQNAQIIILCVLV